MATKHVPDILMAVGFAVAVCGVAFIYWPAALIVGGSGLCALAWKMARVEK